MQTSLIEDLVHFAAEKAASAQPSKDAARTAQQALLALSLFLAASDPVAAIEQLSRQPAKLAVCHSTTASAPCAQHQRHIATAGELVLRFVRDDPTLAMPNSYYRMVAAEVLRDASPHQGMEVVLAEDAMVEQLVRDLRTATRARLKAAADSDLGALATEATPALSALIRAVSITAADFSDVGGAAGLERALLLLKLVGDGDLSALLLAMSGLFEALNLGFPSEVISLGELLTAPSPAVFRRLTWRQLGLGPWIDDWVLDGHVGVPRLDSAQTTLNGDGALGFLGRNWGGVVGGGLYTYQLKTADQLLTKTDRIAGTADAFFTLRAGRLWRLDIGAMGGGARYTTLNLSAEGIGRQQSSLGFGGLLAGLRGDPSSALSVAAHTRIGLQLERFSQVIVSPGTGTGALASGGIQVDQSSPVTVRAELRLATDWAAWREVLSIRFRADASVARIQRADIGTTVNGAGERTQSSAIAVSQLETYIRTYLVLECFEVEGFYPALHAGLNFVTFLSGAEAHPIVVPLFGLGIRREAM